MGKLELYKCLPILLTYVIVVTWARVIGLICMPKALGPVARGLRAYISDKSRVSMLQLICSTFQQAVLKLRVQLNCSNCFYSVDL